MAAAASETQLEQTRIALAVVERLGGDNSRTTQRLKAQLAGLRSLPGHGTVPQADTKVFRFRDLPPELRDEIYDLCLAKGKVFLRPRPKHDQRYDGYEDFSRTALQLLMVSRQIRAEAAVILLRRNHFVMSYEHDAWETLLCSPDLGLPHAVRHVALAAYARKHLTSISITLDLRGLDEDALSLAGWIRGKSILQSGGDAAVLHAHARCTQLANQWSAICEAMILPKLRFLQVNVANCLCPLGCHRLFREAAWAISSSPISDIEHHHRLETIEILGTMSRSERNIVIRSFLDLEDEDEDEPTPFANRRPIIRFKKYVIEGPEPRPRVAPNYPVVMRKDVEEGLEDEDVDLGLLIDAHKHQNGYKGEAFGDLRDFIVAGSDSDSDNDSDSDSE